MNETLSSKDSGQLLRDVLAIRGIDEVYLVGRDGFVIESLGSDGHEMEMDAIGASLASTMAGVMDLQQKIKTSGFKEMYVEYADKMIISVAVDDLFVSVVASDITALASIRFKMKKQLPARINFG